MAIKGIGGRGVTGFVVLLREGELLMGDAENVGMWC